MSVNLFYSEKKAGGAYGVSGSLTMRFKTDQVTPGKRTATIQCDPASLEVDWGDGTIERLRGSTFTHEYETAGVYDVKVSTIGASRFTPRYSTDLSTGLEGCRELIALLDGSTWRASSNLNGSFTQTSLSLIDASCQQAFEVVTSARSAFRGATDLTEIYDGFNMPLCADSRAMFMNTSLVSWPESGTFEDSGANANMFEGANLASFPDIAFGKEPGSGGAQGSWFETWSFCPFVQGGIADNFRVPAGTTFPADWGRGALWTTPPAIQWPSSVSSAQGFFANSPNLTAITKESLDFRAAAAINQEVQLSFSFAGGCPQLTSVDFSYMPTFSTRQDNMSASITTWIMPVEPMPYLLVRDFSTANSRLDLASTGIVLSKLAEHVNVFGAPAPNTRTASLVTGFFVGGPPSSGPYAGLLDLPLRFAPGTADQPIQGCAAIQDWTPQMVADKDALVAAGIRVAYRDTVNGL